MRKGLWYPELEAVLRQSFDGRREVVHVCDRRQTEHGAHLAVVLGPCATHDVEHGGAHGVADVEQLSSTTLC